MLTTAHLADQLKRSIRGEAWHGPAVLELLADVDFTLAMRRPIDGAHTIAEIVRHVLFWLDLASDATAGSPLPEDGEPDWPSLPELWTELEWSALTQWLASSTDQLVREIEVLPEAQLVEIVPGRSYNFLFLLQGLPQHNTYHAGQIAILKKG